MKYEMFVDQFKIAKDKEGFIKKHITTDYIPYLEKIVRCNNVVDATMHKDITVNGVTRKIFNADTPRQFYFFIMELIKSYTDIEFDFKSNGTDCYDSLNKNGLIELIIKQIPEGEYIEFDKILKMCVNDLYTNEVDISVWLSTHLRDIEKVMSVIAAQSNEDIVND